MLNVNKKSKSENKNSKGDVNMLRKLFNKVTHWDDRKVEKELLDSEWEKINKQLVEKYFEEHKDSKEDKISIINKYNSETMDILIKERTEYAKNNLDEDNTRNKFSKKYYKKLNKKLAKDIDENSKVYDYVNKEYKLEEKQDAKIKIFSIMLTLVLVTLCCVSSTCAMIFYYIFSAICLVRVIGMIVAVLKSCFVLLS